MTGRDPASGGRGVGPVDSRPHRMSRLEFADLVMFISNKFINIAPERIDDAISHALRQLGEHAGADRCHVLMIDEEAPDTLRSAYEWAILPAACCCSRR